MKIYYVDYENVSHWGLVGIENLSRSSKVYIVSRDTDTLRLASISAVLKSKANIEVLTVSTGGRNALDFQLVTHLMLKYNKNNKYLIIAKDQGYDFAIDMAKSLGKDNIRRFCTIQDAVKSEVNDDITYVAETDDIF